MHGRGRGDHGVRMRGPWEEVEKTLEEGAMTMHTG